MNWPCKNRYLLYFLDFLCILFIGTAISAQVIPFLSPFLGEGSSRWQETLGMQHKKERMDNMTVQDNVSLARSLTELFNSHQSDPTWLEKSVTAFATDSRHTNIPLGITLPGSEGYKQSGMFFAEGFPDSRIEVTNVFATEDQVILEYTGRGTNTGPLHLPMGDIPATGRQAELRLCDVMQIRNGKIVSYHSYYDTMTMLQQLGLVPAMG